MPRAFLLIILALPSLTQAAGTISYNRDIRPILSNNCFFCHGFDEKKREADLRLDTFEGATEFNAIVPGKPEKSELIKRIFTKDADDHMPPVDTVYRLTQKEKEILRLWIKQGAHYEDHWAFQKLTRPKIPGNDTNPIDSFLKRTWNEKGVEPVDKASPRVLLRRLSYDLRGIPPSYEEVTVFQKDPSQKNYLSFVDRWTQSLEHAEHQAVRWLDLVRHADSNGMVSDEPIATGPFRKYVIEAFRNNMNFDQFTREQLAGDLLPDRNDRTLTASAYNRLVKTNCEAGVIEKEALYALKGEHVRALGTVWLGLTTGCAECHDHKYDPILAKDYYSLAAFFDPLIEAGVYEPGDRRVPLHYIHEETAKSAKEHELTAKIDIIRKELYSAPIDQNTLRTWSAEVLEQEAEAKGTKAKVDWIWFPALLPVAHITSGNFTQSQTGREVIAGSGEIIQHMCVETLASSDFGNSEEYFTHITIDPKNKPDFVAFQIINGAYRRMGWHDSYFRTFYWGPKDHPTAKKAFPAKLTHMGPLPKSGEVIRLVVPKNKLGKAAYVPQGMAWIQQGGKVTWGSSGYKTTAHRFFTNEMAESTFRYFWELPLNRDDRKDFPTLLLTSLKRPPSSRRAIHQTVIEMAFREYQNPELTAQLHDLYREIYLHRQGATETLVSKEGTPKKTHVLNRGNFMDESGPVATPAIPEIFGKLELPNPTRLDLANWIVSKNNPLTARVFVNRLWHQYFGRGLSETLEDSGNQGDWPSHVELLDWMAAEFREDWDIRKLTRRLVSSEAYQLSSIPDSLLAQSDPTNRLHARQSRYRLSAEQIRDSALLTANLLKLTDEIPSASFFPYQPKSYWEKSNKVMFGSRYQIWETNAGPGQYQRSLYTFWKRQNHHPALLALDAPTRQECTARRAITNTPAQALALLNDPQFVEAARCLATRVINHKKPIEKLYHLAVQRKPSHEESAEMEALHKKLLAEFKANPEAAKSLLSIGQSPSGDHDPIIHAAWTATARIVLNLHEFLTRS